MINKPFWLMMSPKRYYAFRRQTLSNLIDLYTHLSTVDNPNVCWYCNGTGDELWWKIPTCRAQAWHIRSMFGPGMGRTENPYRKG